MRGYRKEKRRPLAAFFACGSLSADPFPAACPTPWERFQPRAFPVFERDQKLAAEAAPPKAGAEPPTQSPAATHPVRPGRRAPTLLRPPPPPHLREAT